ncbi:hypothetical protein KNE206_68320 [Kitasatospora sp. NE20-6]|uniref:hypothetical protein n=1 Tax=Kitasatospora sp. NE20-6 TaxID=2859066 RepID=UPI0034DCAC0F
MSTQPWVIVDPPDSRGLRKVIVNGEVVANAWSLRELRKTLNRLGYPEAMDLEDPTCIHWRGGDSKTWPSRPWRRRGILALMIVGMLGSAVMHITIGWPDALGALTFTQRIVGIIFILMGLLQGAAIFAALDYWGRRQSNTSGAIVLLGALLTLPTSAILLFMWLEEREYTPYLFAFIPLLLWSVWALYLLIREKAWQGIPHPKKFAAGVAATALLTAVSIAYSTMYQPTAAPIRFILKAEFGTPQASSDPNYVTVPLKLYIKNDGGIPVYIINDDYTVWGTPVDHSANGDGLGQWKADEEASVGDVQAERYSHEGESEVINSGHFNTLGSLLEAGEEFSSEKSITLPVDARYGQLEATLGIDYMRRDRGRLDPEYGSTAGYSWDKDDTRYYCPPDECGEYLVYHSQVRHNNNMVNVTRRPRHLAAFWGPETGYDNFISSVDFEKKILNIYRDGIDEEETSRERDSYGLDNIFTNSIISVSELLSLPES